MLPFPSVKSPRQNDRLHRLKKADSVATVMFRDLRKRKRRRLVRNNSEKKELSFSNTVRGKVLSTPASLNTTQSIRNIVVKSKMNAMRWESTESNADAQKNTDELET